MKKIGEKNVQDVRGGTIYTLSETASDEQAKLLAQNENKADLKAGIGSEQPLPAAVKAEISNILGELENRGKKNRSLALANFLIAHMKDKMKFNLRPQRAANLRVLKSAGVPAVLIELGYLSHIEDEKLLTSPEWRAQNGRGACRRRVRIHVGTDCPDTFVGASVWRRPATPMTVRDKRRLRAGTNAVHVPIAWAGKTSLT